MVYVSRKIIYPVFLIAFVLVFFSIIFFFLFSQGLDVRDPYVGVTGEKVVFNATIKNISNHLIKDIEIVVKNNNTEITRVLPFLNAGDKNFVEIEMDFSTDLKYDVYVNAAFNRTTHFAFELEEDTIKPVEAKVELESNMVVGQEYKMLVSLCNKSNNDLYDVSWVEKVEGNYFKESFFPRTLVIEKDQCKTFYPTLTPLVPGKANIEFVLRVGGLEQKYSHTITISDK
ncbi:MAG: hypothetical protein WC915_00205 [archaeon]|jgi:hypothetical protein